MLALAHELEAAQSGRSSRGGAAVHDVGARVAVVERPDRHDVGLSLRELEEQPGESLELGALGVGASPVGDLARAPRHCRRRSLEQLGDLRGRLGPRPRRLGDRALDPLEQVGEGREVVERGEPPQRLNRLEDLPQRIVRGAVGLQRLRGTIQRARDRRALARHEGARTGVQARRFRPARRHRRTTRHALKLLAQSLGFGRVGVRPARRAPHEDLEVVHGADRKLLRLDVPTAAALARGAGQRLEPRRGSGDRLMLRHQRTAAQRAGEPHELLGGRRVARLQQGVEPLQVLPRLEGEEVRHPHGLAGLRHRSQKVGSRKGRVKPPARRPPASASAAPPPRSPKTPRC